MIAIELLLLVLCYTALVLTLFLEVICYRRNLESLETIVFTVSLLLLVVSISVSPLLAASGGDSLAALLTDLCMIGVSVTTLWNVLSERRHRLPDYLPKVQLVLAGLLALAAFAAWWIGVLLVVQWFVVFFLIGSVLGAMYIVRTCRPQRRYAHREKVERGFAVAFAALIPLYLLLQYGFEAQYEKLRIGFLLPLTFILLASHKLLDDLKRLSILRDEGPSPVRQLSYYGLTERETQVASLLVKGVTYQNISEQLFISLPTVKTHAGNIYRKCEVRSRHELVALLIG